MFFDQNTIWYVELKYGIESINKIKKWKSSEIKVNIAKKENLMQNDIDLNVQNKWEYIKINLIKLFYKF